MRPPGTPLGTLQGLGAPCCSQGVVPRWRRAGTGWERAAGASDKEGHCSAGTREDRDPSSRGPRGGVRGHLLPREGPRAPPGVPRATSSPGVPRKGLGTRRKQNQTMQHLLRAEGSRNKCPFSIGKLLQGMVLWGEKSGIRGGNGVGEPQERQDTPEGSTTPFPATGGLGTAGTRDGDRDTAVTPTLGQRHSRDGAGARICHLSLSLGTPLSQIPLPG